MSKFMSMKMGASSSVSAATNVDKFDTKLIRRLSMEIKGIERETQYIKEYGEKPNIPSINYNYKKLLDIN